MAEEHNDEQQQHHYHLDRSGLPILTPPLENPDPDKIAERKSEDTYRTEQNSLQRGVLRTQKWIVALTLIGGGASWYGAWVSQQNANIAQQSADTADKSVVVSQRAERDSRAQNELALKQSRDQFTIDERPYIWAKDIGVPRYIQLSDLDPKNPGPHWHIVWQVHLSNYGKSVAHNMAIVLPQIQIWPQDHFEISYRSKDLRKAPNLHGGPLPPTGDDTVALISSPDISKEDFQKAFSRDNGIAIDVLITYKDLAGNPYETHVCARHLLTDAVALCNGSYIK